MTPSDVTGWRFVEEDIHDIASRVTELDPEARLIREDSTGHLGIARWHVSNRFAGSGGYWLFNRKIHDLTTDQPLSKPDGRVLQFMRACDNRRIKGLREWHRRLQHAEWMREKRQFDAMHEENEQIAEGFVHALKKDVSARPRAFIPRGI